MIVDSMYYDILLICAIAVPLIMLVFNRWVSGILSPVFAVVISQVTGIMSVSQTHTSTTYFTSMPIEIEVAYMVLVVVFALSVIIKLWFEDRGI